MQFKRLQMKIAVWAGICLLLSTVIIVGFAGVEMRRQARANRQEAIRHAKEYAGAAAQNQAAEIQVWLEVALDAARTLAHAFSEVRNDAGELGQLDIQRHEVNNILKTVLVQNPDFLGVYTAWEPDAFDGLDRFYVNSDEHDRSGRFIPYWARSESGIMLEPLVDYDIEGAGDYYQSPKKTRNECVIDPLLYPVQGEKLLVTPLVAPILTDGIFRGIVGVDLPAHFFQDIVDNLQEELYEGSVEIFLLSHNGTIAAASGNPVLAGEPIQTIHTDWQEDLKHIQSGKLIVEEDEGRIAVFAPVTIGRTHTPWSVNILIPLATITAKADKQEQQALMRVVNMLGVSIICIVAAFVTLWLMARSLVRPIQQSAHFATRLAAGDLNVELPVERDDELGTLATALRGMQKKLLEVLLDTGMLIQALQQGQLEARGDTDEYSGSWHQLVSGINSLVDAFQQPFQKTAEYLQQIAEGNIPDVIEEEYEGDFDYVRQNLNRCITAISGLTEETKTLTQAAIEGRLHVRGDAPKFGGEYAAIIEGINVTLATLVRLFDQLPTIVMILDRNFKIQYVNNAGAELAGLPRDQILGQQCYNLFHTDDCGTGRCCSARALQSGKLESGETISRPSKDKIMFASYSSLPIRDQNGTIIGVLENVSDQTTAKHALHAVEQQNWMRSGQAELSAVMRGEQDVTTLAKNIITYLAQYVQAEIGAIYLASDDNGSSLRLAGSHAYTRRKSGEDIVKLGQGFVGQAALEQETIIYSELPEDYLSIKTEHGYERPQQILIGPFMHEGQLKGIIEIGTSSHFTPAHVDFVKHASESIAVALHSAETRVKMQELLEHSQQQAEELQVQTEELQAQAEELQAQHDYQSK